MVYPWIYVLGVQSSNILSLLQLTPTLPPQLQLQKQQKLLILLLLLLLLLLQLLFPLLHQRSTTVRIT